MLPRALGKMGRALEGTLVAQTRMLGLRREADRLQLATEQGRFHRRRATEETAEGKQLVLQAISAVRDGDGDALRFLYLRYSDGVYSYVCSIVRDEHEAEDVTQSIFARLPVALARYQPQVVPFASWILRVAHNAAIDSVRAHRQIPCEEVRDPNAVEDDGSWDRLEAIRAALREVPAEQREVLVLRFVGGLTPGEIAVRMGRTENAVHALQHRGRRRLRTELERLGAAPAVLAA